MANTNRNSTSECSETVSEASGLTDFVSRRITGEVPIFGGDPRTGTKEFFGAVGSSMTSIFPGFKARTNLVIINPIESPSPLRDAALLDNQKIQVLLENSELSIADISKYLTLISETKRILTHKEHAILRGEEKMNAPLLSRLAIYEYRSIFELVDDSGSDVVPTRLLWDIRKLEHTIHYSFDCPTLAAMAITHDSLTPGGESNRVLAYLGDALLRHLTALRVFEAEGVVMEIDRVVQNFQSNSALRDAGVRLGLDKHVRASPNVDVCSKKVMATVVEALCGAIWIDSRYNVENCMSYGTLLDVWPEVLRVKTRKPAEVSWWTTQDQDSKKFSLKDLDEIFR